MRHLAIGWSMRRSLAAVVVVTSLGLAGFGPARAQALPQLTGVPAAQPSLPVKLQSCTADLAGQTFTPRIVFDSAAKVTVVSYTVLYTFFDASNLGAGDVSFSSTGAHALPARTATFTCSVTREVLSDGTTFPVAAASSGGPGGTALVVAGVVGVSLIAALSGHGGSGATVNAGGGNSFAPGMGAGGSGSTPSPTPSPSSSANGGGSSPSPSPVGSGATPSASPTATGTTPSPSPSATSANAIMLTPASLSFTSIGATMTATLSEPNYAGTFSTAAAGNSCTSGGATDNGSVATIAPTASIANGQPNNITVKSNEAGRCTVRFVDNGNPQQSATLTIDVTGTTVVVNARSPEPRAVGRGASTPVPATTVPVPAPVQPRATLGPAQGLGSGPHVR